MKNFISYNLTRTIPGPKLRIKSPDEGFAIIREWTQNFTIGQFSKFELQLLIPRKNYPKLEFLDNPFNRQPVTGTFDDKDFCTWTFVQAKLPELFKLINAHKDFFIEYDYTIIIYTDFIFLDKYGNLLKGQNLYDTWGHSHFLVFIDSDRVRIEPYFKFPFENDSKEFNDFYKFFETNFPFKLNEKNLYLTLENPKSKYGSTTRKLRK